MGTISYAAGLITILGGYDSGTATSGGASLAEIEASTILAKEATVATKLSSVDYTAPDNASISAINNRLPASPAAVSDVQVSGGFTIDDRMALSTISSNTATLSANYVAPDNAGIYAINGRLPINPASVSDVQVSGGFTSDDRVALNAIPTNTLLTTDSRLNNLDSSIASILTNTVDGTISVLEAHKILLAALVGKTSGVGSNTEQYLAQDGTTPVITAVFDSDNNRTEVTLNAS